MSEWSRQAKCSIRMGGQDSCTYVRTTCHLVTGSPVTCRVRSCFCGRKWYMLYVISIYLWYIEGIPQVLRIVVMVSTCVQCVAPCAWTIVGRWTRPQCSYSGSALSALRSNLRSFNAITHTHLFQLCLLQQFLVSRIRQFECLQSSQQLNLVTAWACTVHASLVMHSMHMHTIYNYMPSICYNRIIVKNHSNEPLWYSVMHTTHAHLPFWDTDQPDRHVQTPLFLFHSQGTPQQTCILRQAVARTRYTSIPYGTLHPRHTSTQTCTLSHSIGPAPPLPPSPPPTHTPLLPAALRQMDWHSCWGSWCWAHL